MPFVADRVDVQTRFPLSASANGRYLVDARGKPFLVVLRNAWSIIGLTWTEQKAFLCDTAARGFTGIEPWIPGAYTGSVNVPRDGFDRLPFTHRLDGGTWSGSFSYSDPNTEAPDLTTLNESYWKGVDDLFTFCESLGLVVLWFPQYVGYPAAQKEGWMAEMEANGTTKCQTYGSTLANRYKEFKNLILCYGGDRGTDDVTFTAGQTSVQQAFINGVNSVANQQSLLRSAEWRHPSVGTEQADFGTYMSFNPVYVTPAEGIADQCATARAVSGPKPCFLLETTFENQGNPPERRFMWWGWLGTCGGTMMGHDPMFKFTAGWEAYVSSQCSRDLSRMATFLRSIEWHRLNPHNTMITAGSGTITSNTWIQATVTTKGDLAVVYRPPAHSGTFTVDMTVLRGTALARWFDPTNSSYTLDGTYANTGTRVFTVPGTNSLGEGDWILRMDA